MCGVPGAVTAIHDADEAMVGGGTSGEGPAAARADGGRPDGRQGGGCGWNLASGGQDAGGRGSGGAGDRGVRRLGFSICRM
jgi:hypothetical protein